MAKYNAAEIESALNSIEILVDTREKVWGHIESGLKEIGCPCVAHKLDFGDYSYKYTNPEGEDIFCHKEIVVERKANAEEISGNLTKQRERFKREFEKANALGTDVYLLIENCNWGIIDNHGYRTNFNPKSFEASLFSFMAKYNLKLQFCNSTFSAKLIHGIFRYHLRNKLERAEGDSIV